jgi:hypothetical protein
LTGAPLFRVGLSQASITVARMPRFGVGSVGAVEQLACAGAPATNATTSPVATPAATDANEPWRPAVERLAQWLSEHKGQHTSMRVQVVLSGRFVRWQLLPWRVELSGHNELAAYAALRFRETYGKAVQGWNILPTAMPPGHTTPAAAVDRALVDALNASCKAHGARLQLLTPYFSSAFDAWQGRIKGHAAWFGTLEADTLTLGLLQGGQWAALQTQRWSNDWREPLRALMAQIALSCDVPGDVSVAAQAEGATPVSLPLYLAGDMAAPTPQASMPFTWLAPPQLAQRSPAGLRLAMGL